MDSVEKREREFHDRVFAGEGRPGVGRFYAVTGASRDWYARQLAQSCVGANVLEYGCGPGSSAFDLAPSAAGVTGIDISDVALERARQRADSEGLRNLDFRQMNAEDLQCEQASFDLVCGSGILHHLNLPRARSEIARVLRPGGRAVFFEPLAHNPLIELYRKRTPELRTEDEHPLTMSDLRGLEEGFGRVECRFFHLATLAAIPFVRLPGSSGLVRAFDAVDRLIFRVLPFLRRYAWIVVIRLERPA